MGRKNTYTHNYDTACKKKINTKPRFELSTEDSSIRARQYSQPARGKSARYAREFSFARCHDEAGARKQHGTAASIISRTGRPTSPEVQITELNSLAKLRFLELKARNGRTAVHSTPQKGWSTSRAGSTQPRVATSGRISEWRAQRRSRCVLPKGFYFYNS